MIYFILLLILMGCESDDCEVAETRCKGDVVEICNGDRNWENDQDCKRWGEYWTCMEGECNERVK